MSLDLFRLDGRTALVTGASRGLGAAMAIALASAGADVVLHAREEPPSATAAEIATATGRRTHLITADLKDSASAPRIVEEAVAAGQGCQEGRGEDNGCQDTPKGRTCTKGGEDGGRRSGRQEGSGVLLTMLGDPCC